MSPSSKLNITRGQETSQNNTTPLKSDPQAVSSNSNMPSNAAPFFVNQQLEAIDENETPKKWYKANVVQVDVAEQKILVHFKGFNKRYDQWKPFSSKTIRILDSSKLTPSKPAIPKSLPAGPQVPKLTTPTKKENTVKPVTPKTKSETPKSNSKVGIQNQSNSISVDDKAVHDTPEKRQRSQRTSILTEELKSDESLKVPEPEQKPTSPMKQADVTRRTTPLEQNEKIAEGKPTVLSSHVRNYENSLSSPVTKSRRISAQSDLNESNITAISESDMPPANKRVKADAQQPPSTEKRKELKPLARSPEKLPPKKVNLRRVDIDFLNQEFFNLATIDDEGALICKAPGCNFKVTMPNLMKYHLEINHTDLINGSPTSIVVASKPNGSNSQPNGQNKAVNGSVNEKLLRAGVVKHDEIEIDCICKKSVVAGFLIRCSVCEKWQHGNCIQLTIQNPPSTYACFKCIFKPNSTNRLSQVLVTTVSNKQFLNAVAPSFHVDDAVIASDTFQISHSVDTYRSILQKLKNSVSDPNVDTNELIKNLTQLQEHLLEKESKRKSFDEIRQNIDHLILKFNQTI